MRRGECWKRTACMPACDLVTCMYVPMWLQVCRGFDCISVQRDSKCFHDSWWMRRNEAVAPKWDVIVFNFGLHDIERDRSDPAATLAVPLGTYKVVLENVTDEIVARSDRAMWVTTTPVPANGTSNRLNSDIEAYNAAAARIMDN